MELPDFIKTLEKEVEKILSPEFQTEMRRIDHVPALKQILKSDEGEHEDRFTVRRIRTTVLYIDVRRSIQPGFKDQAHHKSKVYFTFLRLIVRAAEYFGGKVCSVVGDRVMVLFDEKNCFTKAINTAFLLNTVAQRLLEPSFPHRSIRCGIGIDYGRIMMSKVQVAGWQDGDEPFNSLVWLGKPTNRASKLTEAANRSLKTGEGVEKVGRYYHELKEWSWKLVDEYGSVFSLLGPKPPSMVTGPSCRLRRSPEEKTRDVEPILVTGRVYHGLQEEHPDDVSLKRLWWSKKSIHVPDYRGEIYGVDAVFDCF